MSVDIFEPVTVDAALTRYAEALTNGRPFDMQAPLCLRARAELLAAIREERDACEAEGATNGYKAAARNFADDWQRLEDLSRGRAINDVVAEVDNYGRPTRLFMVYGDGQSIHSRSFQTLREAIDFALLRESK